MSPEPASIAIPEAAVLTNSVDQLKKEILGELQEGPDKDAVVHAIAFAEVAHSTQLRNTNEPFIVHPLRAMKFALECYHVPLFSDPSLIVALLQVIALHDVIEDTAATKDQIEKVFGKPISQAVYILSKKINKQWKSKYENAGENKAYYDDLRWIYVDNYSFPDPDETILPGVIELVCMAKIADRWENIKTLSTLPKYGTPANEARGIQYRYLEESEDFILTLLEEGHPLRDRLHEAIEIERNRLADESLS